MDTSYAICTTGASAFLPNDHMFRGMMADLSKVCEPLGFLDGLRFIMCFKFYGLCTPWGQMSFWAAQVILSLVGSIPFGEELLTGSEITGFLE